jgi:hypothetical protein
MKKLVRRAFGLFWRKIVTQVDMYQVREEQLENLRYRSLLEFFRLENRQV